MAKVKDDAPVEAVEVVEGDKAKAKSYMLSKKAVREALEAGMPGLGFSEVEIAKVTGLFASAERVGREGESRVKMLDGVEYTKSSSGYFYPTEKFPVRGGKVGYYTKEEEAAQRAFKTAQAKQIIDLKKGLIDASELITEVDYSAVAEANGGVK